MLMSYVKYQRIPKLFHRIKNRNHDIFFVCSIFDSESGCQIKEQRERDMVSKVNKIREIERS
jgi:hypothetical protein